jgi:YidC/Oxa1 family membrane protein insertase
LHLLIAANWFFDPIVNALWQVVSVINEPIKNLGWSMIVLAAIIRLVFWPLNTAQFKAMLNMQKIAPLIKRLQARYKDDAQRLQQETMALYKEHKVNPLAGCWPMIVQYPVIISVYYVVLNHRNVFENQTWGWIGTAISQALAHVTLFGQPIVAQSLAHADLVLVILYALSMYLSVRYVSMPATDPQQAQTQRIMAVVSPVMLGFFGWKYQWPSAMVLYWFAYNMFLMGQQFYLLRRYHQPLAVIDSEHVITAVAGNGSDQKAVPANAKPAVNGASGSASAGSRRKKKRNKKGA